MIRIVDNFLRDAEALELRRSVLAGEFQTVTVEGVPYHGISTRPFEGGEVIARAVGLPVRVRLSFFRLNCAGDAPSTYIHADDGEAQYAGVLYLSDPEDCAGGTAFWRHRALRSDRVPETGLTGAEREQLRADGLEEGRWWMRRLVPMHFNRFVTYRASAFHSRYPKETWGATKERGRLIWAVFYDRA